MKDNITHFSNPIISKFVFNNFDRFFYILIIIVFLITYKDLEDWQIVRVIEICAAIIAFLFLISRLLKRAIHAVQIHWDEKKLYILFYKTKDAKIVNFDEVQRIKVNGAIYIKINGKTNALSTDKYSKVLLELNKIRKIQWGKYRNILGPNKDIRDEINQILSTSI